ncbi:MAG: hypothetical protein CMC13_14845 [Flavobacteriaceae bacterium]|nr:hypothetical protein [Flavobacteriaceae bacterium]|tara:strand:- start:537 stop:1208 length:672 start_codon:yes stop_codon:yes gene_type:complete
MRTFIFFLAFLSFSCNDDNEPVDIVEESPQLVVILYDISKSIDSYGILKNQHLGQLYDRIAFSGGGKVYAYHIKSNSLKQEAIEFQITAVDTLRYRGNRYQNEIAEKKNKEILQKAQIDKSKFIEAIGTQLILPKEEGYTDIENALKLAEVTLEQVEFKVWDKHLIIISDGIHDIRGGLAEDSFEPVQFSDVNIIMVRASKHHFIEGSSPVLTNTISDAINNL